MKSKHIIIVLVLAVIAIIVLFVAYKSAEAPINEVEDTISYSGTNAENLIKIDSPKPGSEITSPLIITGEARGNWYFEASFPVEVLDEDGTSLGIGPVQARGEWMTTEYVPFSGSVSFKEPKGKTGKIIFRKDNPSGLTQFDDQVSIPVSFE